MRRPFLGGMHSVTTQNRRVSKRFANTKVQPQAQIQSQDRTQTFVVNIDSV